VKNYEVPAFPGIDSPGPTSRIPHLYYFDPIEGVDMFGVRAPASVFVDIAKVIDVKARMLGKHESQREWLRAQHGVDDYVERMRGWARQRGKEVQREFAEAFRQHVAHAFPRSDLLSGVLKELVVLPGDDSALPGDDPALPGDDPALPASEPPPPDAP
jgi:hypothetical protein